MFAGPVGCTVGGISDGPWMVRWKALSMGWKTRNY